MLHFYSVSQVYRYDIYTARWEQVTYPFLRIKNSALTNFDFQGRETLNVNTARSPSDRKLIWNLTWGSTIRTKSGVLFVTERSIEIQTGNFTRKRTPRLGCFSVSRARSPSLRNRITKDTYWFTRGRRISTASTVIKTTIPSTIYSGTRRSVEVPTSFPCTYRWMMCTVVQKLLGWTRTLACSQNTSLLWVINTSNVALPPFFNILMYTGESSRNYRIFKNLIWLSLISWKNMHVHVKACQKSTNLPGYRFQNGHIFKEFKFVAWMQKVTVITNKIKYVRVILHVWISKHKSRNWKDKINFKSIK